jgi:glycosyltransferase involved in cell wall biosynthesis
MPETPEVSVVIPSRDRWPLLAAALASALAQDDVRLEVIVVDDGSSDVTPECLAEVGDARLRIVRHEHSLGVARARNRGVEEARGPWIALLDDDDTWAPAKLRTQLDALDRAGGDFAYASAVHVDEHGRVLAVELAPAPAALAPRLLTNENPVPAGCSNVVASTALLRRIGGFDERLFHLADWDLWLRLVRAGRAVACPEVLVAYLKHPANMLTAADRDIFAEFGYLSAKHGAEGAARGLRFDGVGLSRWVASGHRRAGRRTDAARAYLRGAVAYRSAGNALRAAAVLVTPRARAADRPPAVVPPPWLAAQRRPRLPAGRSGP